jgi:hypothetical protein
MIKKWATEAARKSRESDYSSLSSSLAFQGDKVT